MPFAGAVGARTRYARTTASLAAAVRARRRYHSATQKHKSKKVPTLVCSMNMFIATCIAFAIFVIGLVLSLLGYYATHIMGLPNKTAKPPYYKGKVSDTEYIQLQILYNLRFAGPVIMGMGGFVMLCVCVLMYNEKDRLENGESKLVYSDDDIYQKAIQDYFEREHLNNQSDEAADPVAAAAGALDDESLSSSLAKLGSLLIENEDQRSRGSGRNWSRRASDEEMHFLPLSVPKIRHFKLHVRQCNSVSDTMHEGGGRAAAAGLLRQNTSTTCSSSTPTLLEVTPALEVNTVQNGVAARVHSSDVIPGGRGTSPPSHNQSNGSNHVNSGSNPPPQHVESVT